eukprot:221722_1
MGNTCKSSKNNLSEENKPKRNIQKHVFSWDVNDVFSWLSTTHDGSLYELATKFKQAQVRGCTLNYIRNKELIAWNVSLKDRLLFNKVRGALFENIHGRAPHARNSFIRSKQPMSRTVSPSPFNFAQKDLITPEHSLNSDIRLNI